MSDICYRDIRLNDATVSHFMKGDFAAAAAEFFDKCESKDNCWRGGDWTSCIFCLNDALRARLVEDDSAVVASLFSGLEDWAAKAVSERDFVYITEKTKLD